MKTIRELTAAVESNQPKSAWDKAVKQYALELIEEIEPGYEFHGSPEDMKKLLNGADNWSQYSYGGCSLVYNSDIAERTCSPSVFKRSISGERNPNGTEQWLDVQARALHQAARLLKRLSR